jgi:carbon monoxide dehydrogenase subunit G
VRLEGSIDIAAPVGAVWPVVIDPTDLAACVPGVKEVRQVDPQTFEGAIRASVGPIDGDFSFRAVLVDVVEPERLTVRVEGTDSMTKSRVLADVLAELTSTETGTTLRYSATITTKGRLAIIGDMVLRATAGMLIGQVTRCLRARLEAGAPS